MPSYLIKVRPAVALTLLTLLTVAFRGTPAPEHGEPSAKRPPNIVIILADDLGYADVAFNPLHAKEVHTPHLEALARESVICRQGYVTASVCAPTRAGLLTGRYQQRAGIYTAGEGGNGLPLSETIFPQFLAPSGYRSMQVGKWHLGPDTSWSPALRGFDEVFGFLGKGVTDYYPNDRTTNAVYRGLVPTTFTGYLTDVWGRESAAFIQRNRHQPFFLYLAFNAVHAPLQAPSEDIALFRTGNPQRDTLLAMGKRMDEAIGQVVAELKRQGVWENTLLFFLSDNGGPLPFSADNTPLRGGKHEHSEGGIRVPFLVCWPGRLKPGVSDAVVSSLDILPTALAAAGIPVPTDRPLDGIDLLPILQGKGSVPSRDLFWSSGGARNMWAVRSGDWKMVGVRDTVSLFHLSDDLSESKDLAASMPRKVKELTSLHDQWLQGMASPLSSGKRPGRQNPARERTLREKSKVQD